MTRMLCFAFVMLELRAYADEPDHRSTSTNRRMIAQNKVDRSDSLFDFVRELPDWSRELQSGAKLKEAFELAPIMDIHLDLDWQNTPIPAVTTVMINLNADDVVSVMIDVGSDTSKSEAKVTLTAKTGLLLIKKQRQVAEVRLPTGPKSGVWTIRFRYGMVTVDAPDGRVCEGYIGSDFSNEMTLENQSVVGVNISQSKGSIRVANAKLEGVTESSPSTQLGVVADFVVHAGRMKQSLAVGKFKESLEESKKVTSLVERLTFKDSPLVASAISHQGLCHFFMGELDLAEQKSREALRISQRCLLDRHPSTVLMAQQLAMIRMQRGDYASASELMRHCDSVLRAIVPFDNPNSVRIRANFASCLKLQGQTLEAEKLYDESLVGLRKIPGAQPEVAMTLSNEALCRFDRISRYGCKDLNAELQSMISQLRESLKIMEGLPPVGSISVAQALAKRAVPTQGDEDRISQAQANLATMLLESGNFVEAEELLIKARGNAKSVAARAGIENSLGVSRFRRADFPKARERFTAAHKIVVDQYGPNSPDALMAQSNIAVSYFLEGSNERAMQSWKDNADRIDQARFLIAETGWERSPFVGALSPRILLALDHANSRRPIEAWNEWEASLARGLLDDIRINELPEIKRQKLMSSKHTSPKLPTANASQKAIELSPVSLAKLQSLLSKDTALVGWVDVRISRAVKTAAVDQSWAVVVRDNGTPTWIRLEVTDNLAERRLRSALAHAESSIQEIDADINIVRRECWLPLQQALKGARQIVVITSPRLEGVPLELITGEDVTVSYAPSGAVYAELISRTNTHKPNRHSLLAIGSPEFHRQSGLKQLPASRQEIEGISQLFRGRVVQRVDEYANLSFLRDLADSDGLGRFGFIHFATHSAHQIGPFQASLFLSSKSQMADEGDDKSSIDGEDCLLASEVLTRWRLNAECTTLSACETNLSGDYVRGEGHLGLPYAFLAAGSRNVVASRWKVADTPSMLLMMRFYENLLGRFTGSRDFAGRRFPVGDRMPAAFALGEAQRWIKTVGTRELTSVEESLAQRGLERPPSVRPRTSTLDTPYSHPFFWASFMLIGKGE